MLLKIKNWCKREPVLLIALLLAVVSAFFVPPDRGYLGYVDFRTLAILFCLMAVMAALQQSGVFKLLAEKLLLKVHHIRLAVFILVMLCFFGSMLITNDVALITFVPFTLIVLGMLFEDGGKQLAVPLVVMQTIAANLGSMLTPIGNPQNLYLYGCAGMGLGNFIGLMLPYTLLSFALLALWCGLFPYKGEKTIRFAPEKPAELTAGKGKMALYCALFILSLLAVARVASYWLVLGITVLAMLLTDRKVLAKVDYSLLLTFVGFFIFIGNMGRVPAFSTLLERIIAGNEVLTAVISSQVMSNVPAALLLSGFTHRYDLLLIGTNLGGLGTLIASMASLISFKQIARERKELRGRFMVYFTLANLLFLAALLLFWRGLQG